jgi:hypothetical protein
MEALIAAGFRVFKTRRDDTSDNGSATLWRL